MGSAILFIHTLHCQNVEQLALNHRSAHFVTNYIHEYHSFQVIFGYLLLL